MLLFAKKKLPITENTVLSSVSILVGYVFNSEAILRLVFSLHNQNGSSHLHANLTLSLPSTDETLLMLGQQYFYFLLTRSGPKCALAKRLEL